jgi:hypothetical protein
MIRVRTLTIAVIAALFLAPLASGADLSEYRQFRLDSDLAGIAAQAGLNPDAAELSHQRPARIEQLSWRPGPADSVKGIQFSFYNGALYRMLVDYDRYNTEGLTAHDMIDALSQTYGPAAIPDQEITIPSTYGGDETVKVLARWEDSDWTFDLVRFKYEPSFAIAGHSKKLRAQAQAAVDESIRLDRLEAPQRAIQERLDEADARRLEQEEARLLNKPGFRP